MKFRKSMSALLCAAIVTASLTACGSADNTANSYSNQTVVGKITSIDGDTVTLQLGTLSDGTGSEQSTDSTSEKTQDSGSGSAESTDSQNQTKDTQQGTPPEKPDGDSSGNTDSSDNSQQQGTPPEKPDSDSSDSNSQQQGNPPSGSAPSGGQSGGAPQEQTVTFTAGDDSTTVDLSKAVVTEESSGADTRIDTDDLEKGDVLVVDIGSGNQAEYAVVRNTGSSSVEQGSAANTIDSDEDASDETYTSDGDDENALRVDGATTTLKNITVNKTGGETSSTENGDFYGVNAGLLATNGANVTISGAKVTTNAQNGNGVFSYGEGTTVNISDSTITTSKDNSGGIQTTGGGTTNASNLTVETAGNSSAAIRSDRGGGTVNVDGGTYISNGYNSPAIYSTAAITAKNADLTANNSEALVIEGENSIALTDCTVSGNMSDTKGTSSDVNVHNVMIYQSMSGDAEEGTASFSMKGGSLTSKNGDMFYITNTACTMELNGVSLSNEDTDANLMTIAGNDASHGWGTAGSNGAQVTCTAKNQTLSGNITVDSISTLNLTLSDSSDFTGTIRIVDNADGGTAVDNNAVVTVEEGSTWKLTGDCTLTSLTNNGTINFNGHTITLADGTVLSE